uniref:Uncharacterized protein n=1 Tax=viral metagenome TaxID=1070528 RepID=A0A6M3JGC1_9ZZZZ
MRKCILCNEDTNGSVGKAGIAWTVICQRCKDLEDSILEQKLRCMAYATEGILKLETHPQP